MSLFSKSSKDHSQQVSMRNVKITLENLIAILNDEKYAGGIDPETMSLTLDDIYRYVAGDKDVRIRCPAPSDNPADRFQFMWPEGARVSSRTPSESSRASRHSNKSHHLSRRYTSGNIDPSLTRRAMSVTSSQHSKRYVGFIDEEEDDNDHTEAPRVSIPHRRSSAAKSQNTIKVNGAVMKPSPSLERMFASTSISNSNDNDDERNDEYDISPRPVSTRHNKQQNDSCIPEPISVNKIRQKKARVSNVGFED